MIGGKDFMPLHHFVVGDEAFDGIAQKRDILNRPGQQLVQAEDHMSFEYAVSIQLFPRDFSDLVKALQPIFLLEVIDPSIELGFPSVIADEQSTERHPGGLGDVEENDLRIPRCV